MKADRVVFDTNVLISAALLSTGIPRRSFEAVRNAGGSFAFSDETFAELRARLMRPKFDRYVSQADRLVFLAQIQAVSDWVTITGTKLGCRDPDDDMVIETALAGSAECIVTGDQDLLAMSPYRAIPILRPDAFLARLAKL